MGRFWRGREPEQRVDVDAALVEIQDCLKDIGERLDALDHIEVEWADWFEKFKNLYARLNKRVKREEEKEAVPAEEPISPAAQRIFGAKR